jgi:NADH-quinone oxidoreductase subunit H
MDWTTWLELVIKAFVVIFVLLTGFAYLTLYERRALARIQVRVGPNRAGPQGLLQPIADAVKLIFKEEFTPARADKLIFVIAPVVTVVPAMIIAAVIPLGTQFTLPFTNRVITLVCCEHQRRRSIPGSHRFDRGLWHRAGGLVVEQQICHAGRHALDGADDLLRAGPQSLFCRCDPAWQFHEPGDPLWRPRRACGSRCFNRLARLIFMIATLAEVNRAPFDMPEAEQELAAGYHTEYSGMKFALFFMAEYEKMIVVSMITATLFFGGYREFWFLKDTVLSVDRTWWLGPIYLFVEGRCAFVLYDLGARHLAAHPL